LFNEGKVYEKYGSKIDDKYEITSVDDIYKYSQKLLDIIDLYDKGLLYNKPIVSKPEIENK
jgi:hypothetical protein